MVITPGATEGTGQGKGQGKGQEKGKTTAAGGGSAAAAAADTGSSVSDPPSVGESHPPTSPNPLTRIPEIPLYGNTRTIKTLKDQLASISASQHGEGAENMVEGNETRLYVRGGPKGAPLEQETDGREIWLDILAATSILPPVHVVEAKSSTHVVNKRSVASAPTAAAEDVTLRMPGYLPPSKSKIRSIADRLVTIQTTQRTLLTYPMDTLYHRVLYQHHFSLTLSPHPIIPPYPQIHRSSCLGITKCHQISQCHVERECLLSSVF